MSRLALLRKQDISSGLDSGAVSARSSLSAAPTFVRGSSYSDRFTRSYAQRVAQPPKHVSDPQSTRTPPRQVSASTFVVAVLAHATTRLFTQSSTRAGDRDAASLLVS